jgi:hypothetical protein
MVQGAFANVPNGGRLDVEAMSHSDPGGSFKVTYNVINDPVLSRKVTLSDFQSSPARPTPKPIPNPIPSATPRPSSTPK